MKNQLPSLFVLLLVLLALHQFTGPAADHKSQRLYRRNISGDQLIARAFKYKWENFKVQGEGRVVREWILNDVLPRHQEFIIRLASGQTLHVAHNLDRAPALPPLYMGDRIQFSGQYQYTPQGGLIHHTHKNPEGLGGGWIRHKDHIYQ